jgi:hypothetical protein
MRQDQTRQHPRSTGTGLASADERSPQAGTAVKRGGRGRDTGARIDEALEGQSRAADHKLLTSALRFVSRPRRQAL